MRRVALFLCLAGCARPEFLHHYVPQPPKVSHFTHQLKELVGESRVDILWVIDNSASMGSHQQNVVINSDLFIKEFVAKGGLDWKMGIISTDNTQEPFLGFTPSDILDFTTPDPVRKFNTGVKTLGTWGSGYERPLTTIEKALVENPSFTRKDAILAFIVVTDAPEQSFISGPDFIALMTQIKGGANRVVFYGVLGPQDWGCEQSDDYWTYNTSPYPGINAAFKGKNYPLCSSDFGKNLSEMSKDLVKRVSSPRIPLSSRPRTETLRVTWKEMELKGGPREIGGLWYYDYNLNSIFFYDLDFAPGENEEVVVHYEE